MDVDIKALKWEDIETKKLYKVFGFTEVDDVIVVWYKDMGTGEVHCMSDYMFTLKHKACGSMVVERELN